jgi:outer membrane protein OmpA-like peptidoglycan-associated protein
MTYPLHAAPGACPRVPLIYRTALLVATVAVLAPASAAHAQIFKKIKQAAGSAAESEVLRKVDRTVRKGVRCTFDDDVCISKAKQRGDEVVLTDDAGKEITDSKGAPVTDPAVAAKQAEVKPGTGVWTNYDFVPGDSVLFADDFLSDNVGDFPRRFDLIEGSFEIVEWNGARLLQAVANGSIAIPLPRTLPDRFTMEFDARVTHGNGWLRVTSAPYYFGARRGEFKGTAVDLGMGDAGLFPTSDQGPKVETRFDRTPLENGTVPVRIMADGAYMKVYIGEKRVVNAPNAVFPRTDTLYVGFGWALSDSPIMMGPIRIAGGGRDLYDRLARDGRVATQGILFATGSDRLRPESTPTLKEIAAMLRDHATLKLRIEGHTDAVGDDATNMKLSQQRAASVKRWLADEAGIDPARLEDAGLGETKPAATNETPEGRQQNRRVELVKVTG